MTNKLESTHYRNVLSCLASADARGWGYVTWTHGAHNNGMVTLTDYDGDEYQIGTSDIKGATIALLLACGDRFSRALNGHGDSEDGDVLIQYLAYGELRYG